LNLNNYNVDRERGARLTKKNELLFYKVMFH